MHVSSDDGTCHPGLGLYKYCELVNKAATAVGNLPQPPFFIIREETVSPNKLPPLSASGQDFKIISNLKPLIERNGFINVKHEKMKLPLGPWPVDPKQKLIGAYLLVTIETGFEACGLRLLRRVLDMDQASFTVLTEQAKKDAYNRNVHGYSWQ